ncbi:MAG TPA: phosphate acyltransferase PlsX [Clostridiales bacterium]|nr:phosphate acyltransferase PlsX [Clostridiales bacterium]
MKIIVDAMGGDKAPEEVVKGAVSAANEFGIEICLVGRQEDVIRCLENEGISLPYDRIEIINADEVVTMEDDPSTATRIKKDSSMAVALKLLSQGAGDAVISAGSTGALLTGATLTVKRIRGIRRAALAPVLPNGGKGVMLIDCGANVECTPEYLLQFAYMGSFYAKKIMGCKNPRVTLLNVGTEDTKGADLQKQTYDLLRKAGEAGRINFVGNAEASDLLSGNIDVMVTDGFSGNILLKGIEGSVKFFLGKIAGILKGSRKAKMAALMIRGALSDFKVAMDVSEVGGTALLGISKPVIKAHGSSDARAIRSAIKQAIKFIEAGVIREIEENIEFMKLSTKNSLDKYP